VLCDEKQGNPGEQYFLPEKKGFWHLSHSRNNVRLVL
jgi:hypothetical protein